ncbi:VanZ family protein [Paenibacillus agilis]|uniref:VanZ family protein n=1 Tax=Paenibacillus agilis TaxID=3020863 RepID=A0A559J047_9BACL|nr:VanZ family protein [Paenibacillus agilis]TVX93258.1 VanZ family protein [Paenibacillus agilis]
MLRFHELYLLLVVPVLLLIVYILKSRGKSNVCILFYGVLFYYLIFVGKYTLFPIPVSEAYLSMIRPNSPFIERINLLPLWTDKNFTFITKEQILNIIMTIPFGYIVNYVMNKQNFFKLVRSGIILGTIIETIQLCISLSIKYPYRIIDVNDIIFNLIGVMIGYLIFRAVSFLFVKVVDLTKMEHNTFTKFVYSKSKVVNKRTKNKPYSYGGENFLKSE